jgi:hypothetical protein
MPNPAKIFLDLTEFFCEFKDEKGVLLSNDLRRTSLTWITRDINPLIVYIGKFSLETWEESQFTDNY